MKMEELLAKQKKPVKQKRERPWLTKEEIVVDIPDITPATTQGIRQDTTPGIASIKQDKISGKVAETIADNSDTIPVTTPDIIIRSLPDSCRMLLSILLCILVILRHKSNLKRAFQGKEPRLTFKKSA